MNTVLILYPKQFQCKTKFERKVSSIVSRMQDFCVIFPSDPNNFISEYFTSTSSPVILKQLSDWTSAQPTHAIVFDDGEEFPLDVALIEKLGIPLRKIKISITRVVNIKKDTQFSNIKSGPGYEYIGRGSYWGNPYSMFTAGESREEVIRKFKYDFDFNKFAKKEKSEVYLLAGKRLGCFCKPDACHGDVLADFLNKWDDGE